MAGDPRDDAAVLSDSPPPVDDATTDAADLSAADDVRDAYVGEGGDGSTDGKAGDA